ncbi:MAG: hypothetical protein ACJ789_13605 [Thermomicrobiales bacterium]
MAELKGLFGGGEDLGSQPQRAKAQDFVQRYMQGDPSEGYSHEEAVSALQTAAQHATPEQLQRATDQAVNHLNPDQRKQLNEMVKQRQAGQGFVPIERAGDTSAGGGGGTSGLGDILGSIAGGGGGGGDLGSILGGLLGGQATTQSGYQQPQSGGNGGLGDVVSSPVGKAVIGGIAAFAMKEILDQHR